MPQTRQLAAIMFTDIVGYTALMGMDEQKAFELLNQIRQIQKPIIEKYNGRWIKESGDGQFQYSFRCCKCSNKNPGRIYVSKSVHDNVSNKKDIITEFVNAEMLKSVKELPIMEALCL